MSSSRRRLRKPVEHRIAVHGDRAGEPAALHRVDPAVGGAQLARGVGVEILAAEAGGPS